MGRHMSGGAAGGAITAPASETPELTPPPSQSAAGSDPPAQTPTPSQEPAEAGPSGQVPAETAPPPPEPTPTPAQPPDSEAPQPPPSESPAASAAPAQSETPAEASASPEPQESQGVADPLPPAQPPAWGWAGLGLAAGLVLAGAAALAARAMRRGRGHGPASAFPAAPAGQLVIEKLHEQGARKSQQDSFFVSADQDRLSGTALQAGPGLLAVVADGMGGLSDGDKVSQTAVAAMANGFYLTQGEPGQVLLSLLEQANRAVNDFLGPDGLRRSGSTMVAGLIRGGAFHFFSVGDSRICLYRDGALYQLNREHIYRNELYTGAVNGLYPLLDAEQHPKGGGLTSYLGMGELKYVDIPAQPTAIRAGDVFILMSDGVYNALTEQELAGALAAGGSAADALRAAIQAKGYANQDNYTAVILRC